MKKVLVAIASAAFLCSFGALKDAAGNAVTAETPFGDVDGETGTVGDLVRAGGAAETNEIPTKVSQLENDLKFVTETATNGFLRTEKDPLFTAWTNRDLIAVGKNAEVSAEFSVAIGGYSRAIDQATVAVGYGSMATGTSSTAIGAYSYADGPYSIAIGHNSAAKDMTSVVIGTNTRSHGINTFNVNATSPSLFYLGNRTLQSFLGAYAKPSVTNGLASKDDVAAKADKTNAYTRAEVDAKVDAVGNKADAAYSAAESLADGVNSLAGTIGTHIRDTKNPHKVTAAQVGALPITGGTLTGDLNIAAANGNVGGINIKGGGKADGLGGRININGSDQYGGTLDIFGGGIGGGRLHVYAGAGGVEESSGTIEVNGGNASIKKNGKEVATEAYVDDKVKSAVLPTDPTFSNAVLAVGLNIDTDSVAVLNEIASTFGGFPIEGTATTVGGLLAALAAAVAWLRRNKADKATTLAGYGITDGAKKTDLDSLAAKVDAANAALEEVA